MVRGQCWPTRHLSICPKTVHPPSNSFSPGHLVPTTNQDSCLTVQQLDTWPQGRSREGEAGNAGALCLWPYTEPRSALVWCCWVSRYHVLHMSAFLGSPEFQFGFKKGFVYLDTNREPGGQSAFSEQLLTLTVSRMGTLGTGSCFVH